MTLDHITPLVAGGSDRHKENFVTACKDCNEAKAQLILEVLGDLEPAALKDKFKKAEDDAANRHSQQIHR